MNIFIMLAIALANIIAIVLIYQFIKKLPNMDKMIFIVACFAIAYVEVSITYWISGFGIDSNINAAAKTFITYLFVPVNLIIFAPFIATKYNKWRQNKIKKREFVERAIKIFALSIIILVFECFYFKNVQKNIGNVKDSILLENTQKQEQNDVNTVDETKTINEIQENINLNGIENVNTVENGIENVNTAENELKNTTVNEQELE